MRDGNDPLVNFYRGISTDHRGRMLSQVIQKSDRWLEETHDYIQWLFPLYVRSKFNPNAPLLTDEIREAFTNPAGADYLTLQQSFSQAIYRMLIFYGYSFSPLAPDVVSPTGEWADKSQNWLTDGNHNFMRITRMLRSMDVARPAGTRAFVPFCPYCGCPCPSQNHFGSNVRILERSYFNFASQSGKGLARNCAVPSWYSATFLNGVFKSELS